MPEYDQVSTSTDTTTQALLSVVIESWRFSRVFERMLLKLDAGEQGRYRSQFRWFMKNLEESLTGVGMKIVNVEGHPYDPGIAATALNLEDFDSRDSLIVDQMLEPIIMGKEGLIKTGTVTLRRAHS